MKQLAILAAILSLSTNPAFALDECKENAEVAVDIREDYKSYAEAEADLSHQLWILSKMPVATVELIEAKRRIEKQRILASEVFLVYKGLKGKSLFTKVYSDCIASEKANSVRRARQEARAAAKEAREKAAEEKAAEHLRLR